MKEALDEVEDEVGDLRLSQKHHLQLPSGIWPSATVNSQVAGVRMLTQAES